MGGHNRIAAISLVAALGKRSRNQQKKRYHLKNAQIWQDKQYLLLEKQGCISKIGILYFYKIQETFVKERAKKLKQKT